MARLLAYLLEITEGIEFSRGVSDPDEPTIAVRDLTGAIRTWIDVGTPDAARLHKASKTADRVAVYTHKDPAQFLKQLAGERIHRGETLELYAIDRALVAALVARIERRVAFSLSVTDRELYLSHRPEHPTGTVVAPAPAGEGKGPGPASLASHGAVGDSSQEPFMKRRIQHIWR